MNRTGLLPDNRVPVGPDCLTVQQWQAILERHGGKCVYCGRPDILLTKDHVIPLASGGRHTAENIVPACRRCNISKHSRTVDEFLARRNGSVTNRQQSGCGERVRAARLRLGLSVYAVTRLAGTSGINSGTILRIERGQSEPRGPTLRKIADILGVAPDALLCRKDMEKQVRQPRGWKPGRPRKSPQGGDDARS